MCHPRGMAMGSAGRSESTVVPRTHVVVVVVVVVVVSNRVSAPRPRTSCGSTTNSKLGSFTCARIDIGKDV
jgi:hypothetical protein